MSNIIYNPYVIAILSGVIVIIIERFISKKILYHQSANLTHEEKAEKFRKAGLYKRAILEATEALKIDSKSTRAWTERADNYLNLGKYKEAYDDAKNSLEIESNAMAYEILGKIFNIFKQYDDAIKCANAALEFKAKNSVALRVRAESYYRRGRINDAIKDATNSLNIERHYHSYIIRAAANLVKKKYDKTVSDAKAALKLKPDSTNAQRLLEYARKKSDKQFINLLLRLFSLLIMVLIIIIIMKSASSNLRHTPMQISNDYVEEIIRKKNFYDSRINPDGKGFKNKYSVISTENGDLVIDEKSRLTWQQSGSYKMYKFRVARYYIQELNRNNHCGFHDWRLPTVEEAMSLMEATEYNGCFINSIFNLQQYIIWTADWLDNSSIWIVDFERSRCISDPYYNFKYVRAVRSGIIK